MGAKAAALASQLWTHTTQTNCVDVLWRAERTGPLRTRLTTYILYRTLQVDAYIKIATTDFHPTDTPSIPHFQGDMNFVLDLGT